MKHAKKLVGLLLALVMVLSLTGTALAAEAAEPTGSITVSGTSGDSGVSVEGKTFKAYRILNLKMTGADGFVYSVPEELKEFYSGEFGIPTDAGDFDYQVAQAIGAMEDDAEDLFAFAARALAAAKAAGIQPASATGGAGAASVQITDLPYGYYIVEDEGTEKPISALILDTVNEELTVTIKAEKSTVDKEIDGAIDTDDGTTGDVKNNNAAVGDKVPYKVTSTVPDMTGYTKYYFVLNDTLSKGLTFNADDVAITVTRVVDVTYTEAEDGNYWKLTDGSYTTTAPTDETAGNYDSTTTKYTAAFADIAEESRTPETLTAADDYTVTATENSDGTTSVEIVFKDFIQYKDPQYKNAIITVTYSATINENAVIGTAGNKNEVTLTYSNNPNVQDDGEPGNLDKPTTDSPVGETPTSETRTFVTGIELIKVDPDGNRLTGAEFTITGEKTNIVLVTEDVYEEDASGAYWKLKDGSYTTDDPNAEGMDQTKYEDTTTKYTKTTTKKKQAVVYEVDAAGEYYKLKNNTYTTTAPTNDTADRYVDTTTKYSKKTTDVYTADKDGTYYKLTDGTYTEEAPNDDNASNYESTTIKYKKTVETVDATGTVSEDGVLRFEGLSAGTYTIKEIKAPTGYNLLKDPISVEINWTEPGEGETVCTWTATGGTVTTDGIVQVEVENQAGTELPSTGGMGTTLFYVLGGILVVAAGVLLVTKRRMSAQR